ncbi:hypothetical protein PROAA_810013 [Candidatus Propionivibrio aalborgensis]|uniref:Uncharacterized protein n=1 Tax=Candidatus Propionivibrio aalborgensis TaxID=1860101 RepID=A0A1A8Y1Z8_9RHOO|nr:hypothetical protein PROAA_810013 [Candidatus Propionivibrio aalborgensis]
MPHLPRNFIDVHIIFEYLFILARLLFPLNSTVRRTTLLGVAAHQEVKLSRNRRFKAINADCFPRPF